jgi:hypothetical protein
METISLICLLGARKEARRNKQLAEQLFRRAIENCKQLNGTSSAELGLMLDEFATFLEANNRSSEAEYLYKQIHFVIQNLFRSHWLNSQTGDWFPSEMN